MIILKSVRKIKRDLVNSIHSFVVFLYFWKMIKLTVSESSNKTFIPGVSVIILLT